jgi:hypothetical protein
MVNRSTSENTFTWRVPAIVDEACVFSFSFSFPRLVPDKNALKKPCSYFYGVVYVDWSARGGRL